jgi:hypothetical protein
MNPNEMLKKWLEKTKEEREKIIKLSFEEAEDYLKSLGSDINKPARINDSDPAWIEEYWEKDGKIILTKNEDGYFKKE